MSSAKEHVSEETSEEVILVKDKDDLFGFEVLNYLSADEAKDVADLHVESGLVN